MGNTPLPSMSSGIDRSAVEAPEPYHVAPDLPSGAMVPLEEAVSYYEVEVGRPQQATAIVDARKHAGLASQRVLDNKKPKVVDGITYYGSALDAGIFKKDDITRAISAMPLLRGGVDRRAIGYVTLEKFFNDAQLISAEGRARLIRPNGDIQGLLQALQHTVVTLKTGDEENAEVANGSVLKYGFLGQYVFTGVAEQATASVENRSGGTNYFLYWGKDLFNALPDPVKAAIGLEVLRSSPLLKVGKDISEQAGGLELIEYPIIEGRDSVPSELVGLQILVEGEAFKAHQVKLFEPSQEIKPMDGYLALILEGKVGVNVKDREGKLRKIAEIGQGHTLFEANAAGTPPPKEVKLVAEDSRVKLLYVYLSEDDPNYLRLIRGALKGQAMKLQEANLHEARIKRFLRQAGVGRIVI